VVVVRQADAALEGSVIGALDTLGGIATGNLTSATDAALRRLSFTLVGGDSARGPDCVVPVDQLVPTVCVLPTWSLGVGSSRRAAARFVERVPSLSASFASVFLVTERTSRLGGPVGGSQPLGTDEADGDEADDDTAPLSCLSSLGPATVVVPQDTEAHRLACLSWFIDQQPTPPTAEALVWLRRLAADTTGTATVTALLSLVADGLTATPPDTPLTLSTLIEHARHSPLAQLARRLAPPPRADPELLRRLRAPPSLSPAAQLIYTTHGGDPTVLQTLVESLLWTRERAVEAAHFCVRAPSGILLAGPPGTGKTTLIRAAAAAAALPFFPASPATIYSPFVGGAEAALRSLFASARAAGGGLIFLDEVDALVSGREQQGGGDAVSSRLLSTLLTEMDGIADKGTGEPSDDGPVIVVGATNRPSLLDPALLRPGRFSLLLHLALPANAQAIEDILVIHTAAIPLAPDVCLATIATSPHAQGLSGAEISLVVRSAALAALRDGVKVVTTRHLEQALANVGSKVHA